MTKIVIEPYNKQAHSDDKHVDVFAEKMKRKLEKAREKGRGGWDDPSQCSNEYLILLLKEHMSKSNSGNWVDIANFCMMLEQRNAPAEALV